MQTIITNFLHASALNVEAAVIWALLFVYVALIATTIASIWCSKTGRAFKWIWTALVILCPCLGVILYCIFCLMRADYSVLEQMGFSKKKSHKKVNTGTKKALSMPEKQSASIPIE